MNELQISLSGSVKASNFDAWKETLLAQIDDANRELTTDDDFATAEGLIKSFKAAEDSLKQAKQDALNQVSDIQSLFGAIDEVVERTRETRLALNRQVKTRKEEIKEVIVDNGIKRIEERLASMPDYFQQLDNRDYLSRAQFIEATKRRTTAKTLKASIDKLCESLESAIDQNFAIVESNKQYIDELPAADRELVPDWLALIEQPAASVHEEVESRIATRREREQGSVSENGEAVDIDLNEPSKADPDDNQDAISFEFDTVVQTQAFRIVVDFSASENAAKQYARQIKTTCPDDIVLDDIKLMHRS